MDKIMLIMICISFIAILVNAVWIAKKVSDKDISYEVGWIISSISVLYLLMDTKIEKVIELLEQSGFVL